MSRGRTFEGECPKCEKVAKFEEFFRERRMAKSEMAARRGDFKRMEEYSFRCTACGERSEKVLDSANVLHKWQGHKHVTMEIPQDE